jgi:hypothetical protein
MDRDAGAGGKRLPAGPTRLEQDLQLLGRFWGRSQRPGSTIKSFMTSIHRTPRPLGDPMTALIFHGKEGVDLRPLA